MVTDVLNDQTQFGDGATQYVDVLLNDVVTDWTVYRTTQRYE